MSHDSARIVVFDTTLRDGEQAPGFSMDVASKLTLARALDALGVDIIEAGFPIASPADSEATLQIAREVRRPVIAALARCRQADIEEAARASRPNAPGSTRFWPSPPPRAQAAHYARRRLEQIVSGVRLARRHTDDGVSAEDATKRSSIFCRVVEAAIREGATTINLL